MSVDHRAEYDLAAAAAEGLRDAGFGGALAAIQTGSGIPAPELDDVTSIPWHQIEGFPRATAPGHHGMLRRGSLGGVPVIVMQGRLHLYEGHTPQEIVRPVRALGLLGVGALILTNATGGVRESLAAGDVLLARDHVNLMGVDPLTGIHDPRFGDRFVVTAGRSHDPGLADHARAAAAEYGIGLAEGVYGGLTGPCFETPAEVRRLRALGIDVCGMSTVPEILAATQLGMRTVVLSLVANPAGQVAEGATAEEEVLAVAGATGKRVTAIVEGIVARLGTESA
jgi:purine-nucleoside phosphorylase